VLYQIGRGNEGNQIYFQEGAAIKIKEIINIGP
jgi:hypothetical protein